MQIVDVHIDQAELLLAPIGDIQYGAQGCDVDKLQRHLDYGIEHGWSFLGMGDYLDHFSNSNRQALRHAQVNLYESAAELLDEAVDRRIDELVDEVLDASRGRWLGALQGDHEYTFLDGTHSDQRIAQRLGCPFLGTAAITNVYVGDCPVPLRVWGTHGRGASSSSTGKTAHLERMLQTFDADVYLMAHSHLKYGYTLDRLKTVTVGKGKTKRQKLVHETKALGITGSWLNGYQQDSKSPTGFPQGGYVERGAMRPIPTGGLLFTCKPVLEDWGWRWDIFVTS